MILLIFCGYFLYCENPKLTLTYPIFTIISLHSFLYLCKLSNTTTDGNSTTVPFTLSPPHTVSSFGSHAPTRPRETVKLSVSSALLTTPLAPCCFRLAYASSLLGRILRADRCRRLRPRAPCTRGCAGLCPDARRRPSPRGPRPCLPCRVPPQDPRHLQHQPAAVPHRRSPPLPRALLHPRRASAPPTPAATTPDLAPRLRVPPRHRLNGSLRLLSLIP
jgi:hypothetical protein